MAEVRTLDLETFRSLIREVAGEVISDMQMSSEKGDGKMSEQDEIVALDAEEVPVEDFGAPDMGAEVDDMAGDVPGVELGDDVDVDEDGDDAGMFDMDLSTPQGVADALEDLADMIARAADAVEDVVSTEGGDFEEMEATEDALSEARRLVRRARKSVLRESKRKVSRKMTRRNR